MKVIKNKPGCKTCFSVNFDFDSDKNADLLKERRHCLPKEIGIKNKTEVEKFIIENLGVMPKWERRRFVIGYNEIYDINVNKMIKVTLTGLTGKEDLIKSLQETFSVKTVLNIVPEIVADSKEPHQILSLENDIIDFLHDSRTSVDLDYYVI